MNDVASVEAVLFVAGEEGVSIEELARILNGSNDKALETIQQLNDKYNEDPFSALTIIDTAESFKLVTKKDYADVIQSYAQSPSRSHLSKAALEVLAIVAYKQPITRMEIDDIRGVQSTGPLQKLILHRLIMEKGRMKTPGRPVVYGTTEEFLDYFGLNSLKDLPNITEEENNHQKSLFFESFQQAFEE